MEFYEVIRKRRSIRGFNPEKEIPDAILKRILNAGRIAPSAANRQPWKFVVVKNRSVRNELCTCYPGEWLRSAPVILVAIGFKDKAWVRQKDGHNSIEVDLTIALDHMILAAAAEGIGSCWIMAFDYAILKKILKLKENEFVSCITPLGFPQDKNAFQGVPRRKEIEEILEIIV